MTQQGVLFGHEDTLADGAGWKSAKDDFDSDVYRVCGKFPAVLGGDLGHIGTPANIDGVPFENMKVRIAKDHEKGAISTLSWRTRIPGTERSAWTRSEVAGSLLPGGTGAARLREYGREAGNLYSQSRVGGYNGGLIRPAHRPGAASRRRANGRRSARIRKGRRQAWSLCHNAKTDGKSIVSGS